MKYANEIHGPDWRAGGAYIAAVHRRIIRIYNQNFEERFAAIR